MSKKRFLIMLVTIASMLGAAACTPEMQSAANDLMALSTSETASETGSETASETASDQAQSSGELIVVEETPMSDAELAAQPSGQTAPGAGAAGSGSQAGPGAQGEPQPSKNMIVYSDDTYKFSVAYPADFALRTPPAEKLAQYSPKPEAAFTFMNPVTASSDIVDLEPADLEIRVYGAGGIPVQDSASAELESWLTSNGLLPADGSVQPKTFQTENVSGFEVCASTMIAPGCSYYFTGGGWVYQLTPATLGGEAMVKTFRLIP